MGPYSTEDWKDRRMADPAIPTVAGGGARQVDRDQEQLNEALPGWRCWPIGTWDRRTEWSAMPHGARVAVIQGAASPAALITAVREFEADLPARIADVRGELAAQPDRGIGRDGAAVLVALFSALEALAAGKGSSVAES